MRFVRAFVIGSTLFALSCGGATNPTPSAPSPTAAPAPAPTPAPTPSPTPTPTPPPSAQTATLSGVVRDGQGDSPLAQVAVAVTDGGNAGRSVTTVGDGTYSLSTLQQGSFTVRFSRSGFISIDQSVTLNADATLNQTLPRTCAVPTAPTNLAATITGTGARTFTWTAGSGATEYLIEAGTAPGEANALSATATSTSYVWNLIPNGTYYVRVKGRNSCATGGASNEVVVTVGNTPSPSPSPTPSPSPSRYRIGAVCKDGTLSSATGSGACSSHGGVACWRYNDGTCTNP